MAMTAYPQAPRPERPGLSDFAKALSAECARLGYSNYKIANQCGVGQHEIGRWRTGEAVPSPLQYKRLCGLLRRLVMFPAPSYRNGSGVTIADSEVAKIRDELRPQSEAEAKVIGAPTIAIVPKIAIVPEPAPAPKLTAIPFAAALKKYRMANNVSQVAFGKLLDVHSTAVTGWEKGKCLPLGPNYDHVLQLLPELAAAIERGEVVKPTIHPGIAERSRAIQAALKSPKPIAAAPQPQPKPEAIAERKPWPGPVLPVAPVVKVKPKARPVVAAKATAKPKPALTTFGQLAEAYAYARADVAIKRKLLIAAREAWNTAEASCRDAEAAEKTALAALDKATSA